MRPLLRTVVLLLSATASVTFPTGTVLAAETPHEGVQYVQLQHPQPVGNPASREVVEFFWYDCQHSNLLEKPLEDWAARQPSDVVVRRIPAIWPGKADGQAEQTAHARLYYTLEKLGQVEHLQLAVFHAVQEQHKDLTTEDGAAHWAAAQGLDEKQFKAAYESAEVVQETKDAPALMARYEIPELPSLIVQGRYRTSPTKTDGVDGMTPVLDYLVQRETPRTAH